METKRFISNDLGKLFRRVRDELGEEAVIVSTRQLHRVDAPPLIELIAAAPEAAPTVPLDLQETLVEAVTTLVQGEPDTVERPVTVGQVEARIAFDEAEALAYQQPGYPEEPAPMQPEAYAPEEPNWEGDWLEDLVPNAPSAPAETTTAAYPPFESLPAPEAELPPEPAFEPAALVPVTQAAAHSHEPVPLHPAVPGGPAGIQPALLQAGFSAAAARTVAGMARPEDDAARALARAISLPVRYPAEGATSVITVQGPEGSGRTTALLRMAMDCAEAGREAVLVAADPSRAGGRDMVHAYAAALGLQAVDAFSDSDIELLARRATPGTCFFADVAPGALTRVALLEADLFAYRIIPAHWQPNAAAGNARQFEGVRFAGAIVSCADLAPNLTPALSQVVQAHLGLAFLSSDRDVATGITAADPLTLALGVLPRPKGGTADVRTAAFAQG